MRDWYRYDGGTNEDGEPHGHGIFRYRNGDRYEGGWKDGGRHGHGVYEYADGGRYEGGWKDGKEHGFGKWKNPYPKEAPAGFFRFFYEGGWKDGHRHGYGISIVWEGEEQKFYRKEGNFEWSHEKDNHVFDGVTCQVKYENGEWVDVPAPAPSPRVWEPSYPPPPDNLIYCKGGCGEKIEPVIGRGMNEDDTCDWCNRASDEPGDS